MSTGTIDTEIKILDAGKWFDEYLSKSELCEMEGYGSDDDAEPKFLKDIMGE
mgnify:CR=1 FL=1